MKRAAIVWLLVLCLSLSGCQSFLAGEYIWEQTHYIPPSPDSGQDISASNYFQLTAVLAEAIEKGTEDLSVSVAQYDRNALEADIQRAAEEVRLTNPVAAYAVSDIDWQVGKVAGETVLVVQVQYSHDKSEIDNIVAVADNAAAMEAIAAAMKNCEYGIVLHIAAYEQEDFRLAIESYAEEYPQYVMESPQVFLHVYPDSGTRRVVEIQFRYVNGRDSLRDMQNQVLTLFDASVNMVSVTEKTREKYVQMYSLVVERIPKYTIETSITPAYSLLVHGVGDSRAFALVYAAMCREAGLSCQVVAGTKGGNQWYWNIVQIDGIYYHVDLLRSKGEGTLRLLTDNIIHEGYVWDFSAYPVCG